MSPQVPKPEPELVELLYRALNAEGRGIIVSTNSVERLRARFYAIRKEDPDLAALSFTVSPTSPETELWIIKRYGKSEPTETHAEPSGG